VTRPLRELTERVGAVARGGLDAVAAGAPAAPWPQAERRDEFGRLAAGFRTMLQRLQEQWQARERVEHFRREGVSNLSHDLRSPLTAAAACLETLHPRLAADEQRLVEVALRNTRDAARLVRSLGELAQLDEPSFALTRDRLDAAELLDGIALRFAPRAAAQGASIAVDAAPELQASLDVELFERAVANLVDNALRHGARPARAADAAGAPALQVVLGARRDGDMLVVSVADDGAGIGAEELPRLFDRFYQARGAAAGDGGRGLGLAIVKRIAELHGGTVAASSRPGAGATFTLRLPAG
jgi:signal transduction histidine kinase